jgi:hypothetical protein
MGVYGLRCGVNEKKFLQVQPLNGLRRNDDAIITTACTIIKKVPNNVGDLIFYSKDN